MTFRFSFNRKTTRNNSRRNRVRANDIVVHANSQQIYRVLIAAAAAEDPHGMDLYSAASAVGGKDRLPPSGSIPSYGPSPCAGPPGVESPSYVGGDRRRQEVADVLEGP